MNKYSIEDNIDFYKLLNECLNDNKQPIIDISNNTNVMDQQNQNICLITQQHLDEKYITLKCGHTFNYIPLYNDIYNYNFSLNINTHYQETKIFIKCPYCRSIHNELLPFYSELQIPYVYGINTNDKRYKLIKDYKTNSFIYENTVNFLTGKCCYVEDFDSGINMCDNTFVILQQFNV